MCAVKSLLEKLGRVCVVIGAQWGDEGKGKVVDILAEHYDVVARATGGANAGHTIYVGGKKFVFHLVPAGMLHEGKVCIIGNGVVVHFPTLLEEMEVLKAAKIRVEGRLKISDRAHIVFEYHKIIDKLQEELKGFAKVGTTGRGIGPAYSDKISRIGIRVGELKDFEKFTVHYKQNLKIFRQMYDFSYDDTKELEQLKEYAELFGSCIVDTSLLLSQYLSEGKKILLEGANGTLLDIDHGTYPFVTSSNASMGGVITGTGLAPNKINSSVGVMKAYVTRVGSGPFPTELLGDLGEKIRTVGNEFGATTGRPRRCGWFDVVAARYAMRINGFSAINLTKVDVLNELSELKIGVAYKCGGNRLTEFPADLSLLENCEIEYITLAGWESDISNARSFAELPENCKNYIQEIEKLIGCPIMFIGTGKNREEMIVKA